ncbi:hypothetical protein [Marinobacter fonticola]|uniref:hypothetical protein n=1 Tax=Marinobacter fonticola TaxID=2603215 RepID=UPI001D0D9157|nr:hypothetical protein [Marinobacter fonticola]
MLWITQQIRHLRYGLFALAIVPNMLWAATDDQDHKFVSPPGVEDLGPSFFTFSPEETHYPARDSWWIDTSDWVIKQRHYRSDQVQRMGAWADRTLSGDAQALPDNESYLRLGFATRSETGDLAQLEPEARFRLDLPTLEEKLRLVVESESEETKSLSERDRDRQLTDNERSESEATGALRYITQITETLNLSNDVGARLRFPPDAFWRARSRARFELQNNWQLDLDQRFYYFHVDGWGESTWVGFSRPFDEWQFLAASELRWVHEDRNFEFSEVWSLYKRLNNRAELNPRLGIIGESNPNWRSTEYLADLTYRYRIYDTWLFGEVIPAVNFYRDNNFKETTSLTLRIEMFFARSIR